MSDGRARLSPFRPALRASLHDDSRITRQAQSSLLTFRVTGHTALRRPVEPLFFFFFFFFFIKDWLPADHLAWFVIEMVEQLDLAAFYAAYRVDGHGRAAYDPAVRW